MPDKKKNFFVSYNKDDKQWAKWIAAVLEANGNTTYLQAWDFRPGGNFILDMQKALIESERFIAVLSSSYLESVYCNTEWAAAFVKACEDKTRSFFPVRVADIKPEGLLSAVIYIDLYGLKEEEAEKRLLQGVDMKDIPRNRPSFPGSPKARFPGSLPFNNLPYRRNEYFTGREQTLQDISAAFESGSTISLTQAITGTGGLGKTQTALEYAYRYSAKYDLIWWVPAETEASVLSAYQSFAIKKRLLDRDQTDNELILEAVQTWMDEHTGWLFIYDNADHFDADTRWLPQNNRGNVLITTRYRHGYVGEPVDISVFSAEEAVAFLTKRAGIRDDTNAASLSERLGRLPLALEQAAAYIKINGCGYAGYLELLKEYGLALLEDADGVRNYSLPVTATWEISLKKIDDPAARQLLNLCAYLASENIHGDMFERGLNELPSPLKEGLSSKLESYKVWKELTRYSLLERQAEGRYAMHRLLQEVVRNGLGDDTQWYSCVLHVRFINPRRR